MIQQQTDRRCGRGVNAAATVGPRTETIGHGVCHFQELNLTRLGIARLGKRLGRLGTCKWHKNKHKHMHSGWAAGNAMHRSEYTLDDVLHATTALILYQR